jgi:putative transposase
MSINFSERILIKDLVKFFQLGDGDFVENVLKSAQEELEQKYDLKAKGYDFDWVTERVAEVMSVEIEQATAFGKSPQTVNARSLLCF